MMRVRWQTAMGEVDTPSVEKRTVMRDCHEHRRVTVLSNTDRRALLCSSARHVFPSSDVCLVNLNACLGYQFHSADVLYDSVGEREEVRSFRFHTLCQDKITTCEPPADLIV